MKKVLSIILALCLCLCSALAVAEEDRIVVRVGFNSGVEEIWNKIDELLDPEGIDIEQVIFTDYTICNQALADGELDMNSFQHYAFFYNQCEQLGLDLVAIGETLIAPLGLYSQKIKSLDELKEGDIIAIPSDVTNGGRALKVLEEAGLITVDPEAGYTPEEADIIDNPLNLEFLAVEAANTPSLLPDVTISVINGSHATSYGLIPSEDAIYMEGAGVGGGNPYVNILVTRPEDAENEAYLKVLAAYQTDDVAQVIEETYKGSFIPAWQTGDAAEETIEE